MPLPQSYPCLLLARKLFIKCIWVKGHMKEVHLERIIQINISFLQGFFVRNILIRKGSPFPALVLPFLCWRICRCIRPTYSLQEKFFFFFPMQFYLQLQHLHYLQCEYYTNIYTYNIHVLTNYTTFVYLYLYYLDMHYLTI